MDRLALGPARVKAVVGGALALLILLTVYLPTLLTKPAGGMTAYMDDVGEFQVALNVWGTVHPTGYPLYTLLGNLVVSALRGIGIPAAIAPTLYSLMWGVLALVIFYALILHLTGRIEIALTATLILGLIRSVWIHNVIPEVYGMTLTFVIALLALALWRGIPIRRRILLLALIGGLGVAHHRMVAFAAPALLLAVLPEFWRCTVQHPRGRGIGLRFAAQTVIGAVLLAALGFLPYLYLPLRAQAGSFWIYGKPGTWEGFLWQFTGGEYNYLVQPPQDAAALLTDIGATFRVIVGEMTAPLALAGLLALVVVLVQKSQRRIALVAVTLALGYLGFLFAFHRAVMAEAVAMPIAAMLVFLLALAAQKMPQARLVQRVLFPIICLIVSLLLVGAHGNFILRLTGDAAGTIAIAEASRVPRDEGRAVYMMPWSSRYTAVAFSKYVTGENADLELADHTANLAALTGAGHTIYTPRDTFYRYPVSWWEGQIGRVYLTSPADDLVAVLTVPERGEIAAGEPVAHGILLRSATACRKHGSGGETEIIRLALQWQAERAPEFDMSVFIHLLGPEGDVPVAQADSSAPVYGWYPTSRWTAGEIVREHYEVVWQSITAGPQPRAVRIGMYEQPTPGQFVNYPAAELAPHDDEALQGCGVRQQQTHTRENHIGKYGNMRFVILRLMRRIGVRFLMLPFLMLAGCGGAPTANPDGPILTGLDALPRQLATIYLSLTPDSGQAEATRLSQITPSPSGPSTFTPTPTPILGVFMGNLTPLAGTIAYPPGSRFVVPVEAAGSGAPFVPVGTPLAMLPPGQGTPIGATPGVPIVNSTPGEGVIPGGPLPPCPVSPAAQFINATNNPNVRARLGCPNGDPQQINMVTQPFQNGLMFWRDTREIYALVAVGNPVGDAFWRTPDNWNESLPASDPSLVPPENLLQPVRGFGYVWRSNGSIRDRLGWAVAGEQPFQAVFQSFERGWMLTGINGMVYAFGPNDSNPTTTGVGFGPLPQ